MVIDNSATLVSVIIPSFNHFSFVEKAIQSVLNQTYENIELIVIDDCSTDNSHSLLEKLRSEYNFHLIQNTKNEGVAKTINKGIEISTGEYVSFLASDDSWEKSKIELQVKILNKSSHVVCCATRAYPVDSLGKIINSNRVNMQVNSSETVEYIEFKDLFLGEKTLTPSLLIRKSDLPLLDVERGVEDLLLWLNLTSKGSQIAIINQQLLYYRYHENNSHKRKLWLAQEHLSTIKMFNEHPLYEDALYEWSLNSAKNLARENKVISLKMLPRRMKLFLDIRFYKFLLLFCFTKEAKKEK
jgi:alpha-1,3-rhamnosyltransferase